MYSDKLIGKPNALKQVNLSIIRRIIREKGSVTRAEIVDATKISVTTVRTLLTGMQNNDEIIEVGYDDSIGGRKAVRYKLNKNRFFGIALCLGNETVRYLTVNICGEIHESGSFPVEGDMIESVCAFLDNLITRVEIRSIGLGVPGVVRGLCYERKNDQGELINYNIGEIIHDRYGLPMILENDLNAITLGFGCCYLNSFPTENWETTNMAYLHFDKDCLSAGFLSQGRILRGWNNFVGELGLFPVDDCNTLDQTLSLPLSDSQFSSIVSKIIGGICCILNPQFIALGGQAFRKDCLPLINECFSNTLPTQMTAEILYAEDKWHDYFEGMAYLTAEQIFSDVRLITD